MSQNAVCIFSIRSPLEISLLLFPILMFGILQAAGPGRRGRSGWRRSTTRASGTSATGASTAASTSSTRTSTRRRARRTSASTATTTRARRTRASTPATGRTGTGTPVTSVLVEIETTTTGPRAARSTLSKCAGGLCTECAGAVPAGRAETRSSPRPVREVYIQNIT